MRRPPCTEYHARFGAPAAQPSIHVDSHRNRKSEGRERPAREHSCCATRGPGPSGRQSCPTLSMQPLAYVSAEPPAYFPAESKRGPAKGRKVKDNFVNRVVDDCGGAVVRVET